jgi:hypothetical protein
MPAPRTASTTQRLLIARRTTKQIAPTKINYLQIVLHKRLRHGARFSAGIILEDSIEFHAFAPLEALAMRVTNGILQGVHSSHRFTP